jgi:hypothetical protein
VERFSSHRRENEEARRRSRPLSIDEPLGGRVDPVPFDESSNCAPHLGCRRRRAAVSRFIVPSARPCRAELANRTGSAESMLVVSSGQESARSPEARLQENGLTAGRYSRCRETSFSFPIDHSRGLVENEMQDIGSVTLVRK